jgi:signal transduction histidine kinase
MDGWSRRRVAAALFAGVPLVVACCLAAQWPLWTPGTITLATANLFVSVFFYATSVFVASEPGQRVTGAVLAVAALLWPLNWVNEWNAGPLPLIAALEGPLYGLLAVWALLRYPAPWPRRRDNVIVFVVIVFVQLIACLQVVTSLPEWHGLPSGTTWLAWWPDRGAYAVSQGIYNYGIIAAAVAAVLALVIRLARLSGPDRRVMRPVMVAIVAAGIATAATGLALALGSPAVDTLSTLEAAVLAAVPVTFMIAAARRWLARELVPKLIRQLASSPTPASVQSALRDALADPALRLLYRIDDGYVDVDGAPAPGPPWDDPGVTVITADPSADYVVLLTGNLALSRYRETVYAAMRAATLAMENTSLQASISANIHHVAQSARRLASAVNAERRGIRGTVADIRAAEFAELAEQLDSLADGGSTGFPAELAAAQDLLSRATTDLTLLGDGLGPAGLTRLGLAELIETAAQRLRPRIVVSVCDEPLAAGLRAAAYFVLCELMTNAVKHAPGAGITVSASLDGPELVLEVSDDGPGGADPAGSGLRGVADRVAELSGSVTIRSAPGNGTSVLARLPAEATGKTLDIHRAGTDSR